MQVAKIKKKNKNGLLFVYVKKKQYLCSDYGFLCSLNISRLRKVMRNLLLIIFVSLSLLLSAQEKVMVIADPHVLASSLVEDGSAMEDMMSKQRKMLHLSEEIFLALVDTALAHQPDVLLIPGDLTKDGEIASHNLVAEQLRKLKAAGIKTLLIPGNHDIGGKAYSYMGTQTNAVETLSDKQWETQYQFVYNQAIAKDPHSHSYVAEPMPGVTVLAIDASHNDGEGFVSDETLAWVLQQADIANTKGNMIIAMCHWQILEHVDNGGVTPESGRLTNANSVRDALMAHHVHVILTGHMHINSITTYRDTLHMTGDSIVEISTGAPITYPCAYRYLHVAKDRSSIEVQTQNINAIASHEDLLSYSQEWMREHAKVMIPTLAVKLYNAVESELQSYLVNNVTMGGIIFNMLKEYLPKNDEQKIQLFERYLSKHIVDLYLLHSLGNEPEQPDADAQAQALYDKIDAMIHELTDAVLGGDFASMQQIMIDVFINTMKQPVQSLVEDRTHWSSPYHSDRTDDLQGTLLINEPIENTAVDQIVLENDGIMYDIMGQRVNNTSKLRNGIYILNGKKVIF